MKTSLTKTAKLIAALVIVVGVFGPLTPASLPVARADAPNPNNLNDSRNNLAPGQTTTNPSAYANTSTDLQCSASDGMGLAVCVSGFVYYITVGLGSWIAGITAYVFDYAVKLSLVSGAYAFDFIRIGWGIVRDVANMSFLFILIYIAFKIMFQAETAGTTRMLVWVVVIALLVNFSFLMTRVVIDAGNIVALQFYNAIAPPKSPTIESPAGGGSNANETADITSTIMNTLNPQSIIGTNGFNNFVKNQGRSAMYYLIVSSIVFILTGMSLFMLAAVFIFASLRFIMRVIGLWFVIIASPAAFVAAILSEKGMGKWFNVWLGYLLEFAFYPAIFLFMFYIEIRFLLEMNNTQLFNNIYNATSQTQDFSLIAKAAANVGIRLGFIMSTMYLILRSSQWTGAAFKQVGTSWVENRLTGLGRSSLKYGAGLIGGGAGLLGAGAARVGGLAYQQGIGRGAAAANTALERRGIGSSWLGYRARQGLQAAAGAGVGGARSFNQFKDAREKELAEREKTRERAERRGAVQDLLGAKAREGDKAYQEGQGAVENLYRAAGREKEQAAANVSSLYKAARRESEQRTEAVKDLYKQRRAENIAGETKSEKAVSDLYKAAKAESKSRAEAVSNLYSQKANEDIANATKQKEAKDTAETQARNEFYKDLSGQVSRVDGENQPVIDVVTEHVAPPQPQFAPSSAEEVAGTIRDLLREQNQSLRDIVGSKKAPETPTVAVNMPTQAAPTVQFKPSTTQGGGISDEQINKLAKKVAHKLEPEIAGMESALAEHNSGGTPPSPAAPAAAKPAPQAHEVHNDDYPYSQAAE